MLTYPLSCSIEKGLLPVATQTASKGTEISRASPVDLGLDLIRQEVILSFLLGLHLEKALKDEAIQWTAREHL